MAATWNQPTKAGRVLYCADVHAVGYPTVEGIRYLDQVVQEQTEGRIQIKVYDLSILGSEESVVEMVKLGALDMGRISASQLAEVDPDFGVLLLPYLFADDAHKWKVLNGPIGQRLLDNLRKFGITGLCFQEAGYRSFYNSKRPIRKPEDLKGLKMRVQPSYKMMDLIEFLGAVPIPIDYGEVYLALRSGVIDGAENNIPSYVTSGHYQVAKYFSFDRHASIPEVVIVSEKTWLELSPKDRQIILDGTKASVVYQRKLWEKFEADCRQKAETAGCHFNEVDLAAFKQTVEPFYSKQRLQFRGLIEAIEKSY